jgi:hypothetical protein
LPSFGRASVHVPGGEENCSSTRNKLVHACMCYVSRPPISKEEWQPQNSNYLKARLKCVSALDYGTKTKLSFRRKEFLQRPMTVIGPRESIRSEAWLRNTRLSGPMLTWVSLSGYLGMNLSSMNGNPTKNAKGIKNIRGIMKGLTTSPRQEHILTLLMMSRLRRHECGPYTSLPC